MRKVWLEQRDLEEEEEDEALLLLLRAKRLVERIWSFGSILLGLEPNRLRAFDRRIKGGRSG